MLTGKCGKDTGNFHFIIHTIKMGRLREEATLWSD